MTSLKVIFVLLQIVNFDFVNCGYLQDKLFDTRLLQITRVNGLCRDRTVPMKAYFHGVKSDSKKAFVANSTVLVTEDLSDNLKMSAIISRCRSRENLDSCEQYLKQQNLDYCVTVNPDNIIVNESPFVFPYQPKYKCPLKKGIYRAYNFSFSITPLLFFNLDGWYWTLYMEITNPKEKKNQNRRDRKINCMTIEFNVVNKARDYPRTTVQQ